MRTEKTYGITGVEYWTIYLIQDERCPICRRATGKTKRLSVDHDHRKCDNHPPDMGCRNCIRGLLCDPCNQLVGYYDIDALLRAVEYKRNPPAQKVLNP